MKNDITLKNILNIYECEISKRVKNKRKLYNFEINKMQYIEDIITMLNSGDVGHKDYNIFLIYEPKCRLVMSLSIKDKIINHFVTRYSLEKNLTKYLDDRNVATRKNMGTDYAIKLVLKYLNKLKNKHKELYCLKIDISKYFYSIDHTVLKCLLKDKLDTFEYEVISKIIDSTNYEYVRNKVDKVTHKAEIKVSYVIGKGLPIGNMTSQFLSIFYLYKLDHYIVHDLGLKYYVRYMDDFVIIDSDKEKLEYAKEKITDILKSVYKLEVNEKKTWICNMRDGFSFLGYTYKIRDNKTIVRIKRSNIEKIKKRVREVKYLYKNNKKSLYSAFCSIMTYMHSYKYSDNYKIRKIIDRYWYE